MSAPRKITDQQLLEASEAITRRREALKAAARYPTLAALATKLNVSPRYLRQALKVRLRKLLDTSSLGMHVRE